MRAIGKLLWQQKLLILYSIIFGLILSSCTQVRNPPKHIALQHKLRQIQTVTESMSSPSIATDADGNPVIIGFVYRSFPAATEKAPGLSVFKRENGRWLHLCSIETHVTYSAWGHCLRASSSGDLGFTWTTQRYGNQEQTRWSAKRIATAFSSDGGRTWGKIHDVNEWKSGQRTKPKIIPVSDGTWRIFWIEGRGDKEIAMTSVWDKTKSAWHTVEDVEKTLIGKSAGTMSFTAVARNSRFHVLIETMVENSPVTLFLASQNDDTGIWKIEPFTRKNRYCRVNGKKKPDIYPLFHAGLAPVSDDGLVAIAHSIMMPGLIPIIASGTPELKGHIFLYRQTEDRNWLWQGQVDDDEANSDRRALRLVSDSQGRLYASWLDGRKEKDHIYFSYSPDLGITWTRNIRITDEALKTPDYDMSLLPEGRVAFAWSDLKKGHFVKYRELRKQK